ncbi:MAG: hypothetical protein AAB776_02510 [Patescibacteria group bacterium]
MKFSELLHVISVIIGLAGVVTVIKAVLMAADALMLGVSREHLLFCSIILFLMAIWIQLATIHHVMLEKQGKR